MNGADNVRLLREAFSALARGDNENFLACVSNDVQLEHPLPRELWHYGGKRHGKPEMAEYLAGLGETYDIERFEPTEFIAQRDTVAIVGIQRYRIKATGRKVEDDWVMIFTMNDGKASRVRVFFDTAQVVADLQRNGRGL